MVAASAACSGAMYPIAVRPASGVAVAVEPPDELAAGCGIEPTIVGTDPIDGCLVRGDTVDGYWIEVPEERVYRIEIEPRGEHLTAELRRGGVIERAVIGRGRRWSRRLRLRRGERTRIELAHRTSAFVRYRLSVAPVVDIEVDIEKGASFAARP